MVFTTEDMLKSKLDIISSSYTAKGEITSLNIRIKRAIPADEPNPNTGIAYKNMEQKLMEMWKFFNLDVPLTFYGNDENLEVENMRGPYIDIDRVIGSITSINSNHCHVVLNEQGIKMVKAGLLTPETRIFFFYLVQGSEVYKAIKPYILFPMSIYDVTNAYKGNKEEPNNDGIGTDGNDNEDKHEGSSIQCPVEESGPVNRELGESLPPEECPVHDGSDVQPVAAGDSGGEADPTGGNC